MNTNSFASDAYSQEHLIEEKLMEEAKTELDSIEGIQVLEVKKLKEDDFEYWDLTSPTPGTMATTTLLSETFSNTYGEKYTVYRSMTLDAHNPGDLLVRMINSGSNPTQHTLVNGGNLGGSNTIRTVKIQPKYLMSFRINGPELKKYIKSTSSGATQYISFTLNVNGLGKKVDGNVLVNYIK